MKKKRINYIIILGLFLLIIGSFSFNKLQDKDRLIINSEFSLVLPKPNVNMAELLVTLKKVNPNVIFLSSIGKSKSKPILFAVSRFENSKKEKLDTAFYKYTVDVKATKLGKTAENYKLISYNRYKKGSTILYTKISSPLEGQCSVMYYFMKNNYNNVMYEIKLTGGISEVKLLKTIAETIALSVRL